MCTYKTIITSNPYLTNCIQRWYIVVVSQIVVVVVSTMVVSTMVVSTMVVSTMVVSTMVVSTIVIVPRSTAIYIVLLTSSRTDATSNKQHATTCFPYASAMGGTFFRSFYSEM
jgi:hypothetical protein